jgi:hypothetical protein
LALPRELFDCLDIILIKFDDLLDGVGSCAHAAPAFGARALRTVACPA